jgi:hypothetical protein
MWDDLSSSNLKYDVDAGSARHLLFFGLISGLHFPDTKIDTYISSVGINIARLKPRFSRFPSQCANQSATGPNFYSLTGHSLHHLGAGRKEFIGGGYLDLSEGRLDLVELKRSKDIVVNVSSCCVTENEDCLACIYARLTSEKCPTIRSLFD